MFKIFNDVPVPYGLYFQDSAAPTMDGIIELHDIVMFYIVVTIVLVSYLLFVIIKNFSNDHISYKYLTHGTTLEIVWTIFPVIILLFIAFPSFILLYLCDEVIDPAMTIKAIASQWYWTYEYSDFIGETGEIVQFDSYIVPTDMLENGQLRMLDVDARIVVPTNTHLRFIVTSRDVIHDFALPSLGIKCDATPGRLNQVSALLQRESVYYGQCSELCGVLHSSMPIALEAVSIDKFLSWLDEQ
ncbi:cytochrome c oxidase subunit 2 (mitochondrion) [Yarrowia sp. C11]|nr:cytochrome c oxidase subunit 2 [Yarrowia sp. E02]KAG5354316.1 cytochrome c oxidase subunit 2 [Yarrowia sp. C11]